MRRKHALIPVLALLALLLVCVGLWRARNLPRRAVERELGRQLGAEVRIGSLSISGARRFALGDLEVRRMASQPRLEALRVARAEVRGSLGEIRSGVIEDLDLSGVEIRLAPPAPAPPARPPSPPLEVRVGALEVQRARIVVEAGGAKAVLDAEASLRGIGSGVTGQIAISARRSAIEPLLAFFAAGPEGGALGGTVEDLSTTVRLAGGLRDARIEARCGKIVVGGLPAGAGERPEIVLPRAGLAATVRQPREGADVSIEARVSLPFARDASAAAALDPATFAPRSWSVAVHGLDVAEAVALAAPRQWKSRAQGAAEIELAGGADGRVRYRMAAEVLSFGLEAGGVVLGGEGLSVALEGGTPLPEPAGRPDGRPASMGILERAGGPVSARIRVEKLAGSAGGTELPDDLSPVAAELDGDLRARPELELSGRAAVRAGAAGGIELTGRIGRRAENPPALDLSWRWSGQDLAELLELARAALPELPEGLRVDGFATAQGTLRGPAGSPRLDASVGIEELALRLAQPVARAERAGASPSRGPDMAAAGPDVPVDAPADAALSLKSQRLRTRLAWDAPAGPVIVQPLDATGQVELPREGHSTALTFILNAAGRFDPSEGLLIERAVVDLPQLLRAEARGRGDLGLLRAGFPELLGSIRAAPIAGRSSARAGTTGPPANVALDLEGRILVSDVGRSTERFGPLLAGAAPGATVTGSASLEFAGRLFSDGTAAARGEARLERAGFSVPDGSRALEGLAGRWEWSGGWAVSPPGLTLRAGGEVGGSQLLWDSFFADGTRISPSVDLTLAGAWNPAALSDLPPVEDGVLGDSRSAGKTSAAPAHPPPSQGAASGKPDRFPEKTTPGWGWTGRLDMAFPEGPRVRSAFRLEPGGPLATTVEIEVDRLDTTVERYLRVPLGESVPYFTKIRAGGSLRATARAVLSGREAELRGEVRLSDLLLAGLEGFAEVEGMDLELPFDVSWDPAAPAAEREFTGPERKGALRFDRLSLGGLDVAATRSGLRARGDSIALDGGLAVSLFGGTLAFDRLGLHEVLGPRRRLESAVLLAGLDLRKAAEAFELPPLEGRMDGSFPAVRLTPAALLVEGGGQIELFGGRVNVSRVSGEEVLSRYPRLSFSMDFENIDLGSLTRTFDFGEMTGTLRGSVTDCVLFRGAPVRFEARVESVERPGVPRTINVKAINNISIIGTGSTVGVFDRGIHRFFRKYTYDRLGIWMKLEDDLFLLRGLERRGGKELFLKGRLPLPIDVVNAEPGTPVSFSAMLERLRGVDFTAPARAPQ